MNDSPRYASIHDYTRVLSRHRILIAIITIGFVVAAYALSSAQTPEYQASASVQFRDPLQDLGSVSPNDTELEEPPAVRSAQNAELITRPDVTRIVARKLDTDLTQSQLAGSVSATVDAVTNLVVITGFSSDAEFAADLANAYAEAALTAGERDTSQRLGRFEKNLQEQIDDVKKRGGDFVPLQVAAIQNQLLRVDFLAENSQPVRIASEASPPSSPTSPQVGRNLILGGIVGLFLALLAAFGRDVLDRRIHNPGDAHVAMSLPVLGRVPDTAFGGAGLLKDATAPMIEADFEAFRLLRMNLAALRQNGSGLRALMVTSGLPQEGKSTVSMALASAAALGGQTVLLVEGDLRRPAFTRRLGVNREPGLTDYLMGSASPKEILQTVEVAGPSSSQNGRAASTASFVCVTAGSAVDNPAELLLTDKFRDFVEKVSRAYDLVVIDSSPVLAAADALEILPHVDGVLVCARVQQTTRDEARATKAALGHVTERPAGVVVTGMKRRGPDAYGYYYYESS